MVMVIMVIMMNMNTVKKLNNVMVMMRSDCCYDNVLVNSIRRSKRLFGSQQLAREADWQISNRPAEYLGRLKKLTGKTQGEKSSRTRKNTRKAHPR